MDDLKQHLLNDMPLLPCQSTVVRRAEHHNAMALSNTAKPGSVNSCSFWTSSCCIDWLPCVGLYSLTKTISTALHCGCDLICNKAISELDSLNQGMHGALQ